MTKINVKKLNEDIKQFPQVHPITSDMKTTFEGVSRLVMLDRYTFKDTEKKTLGVGDLVLLTIKPDPKFPARGYGIVADIAEGKVTVDLYEEFYGTAGIESMTVDIETVEKPLEIYYEQIARRVATGLSEVESDEGKQAEVFEDFYAELSELNFVPAGRVLYGAGSETNVTFFNCLSGDTVVQTKDGARRIKDLNGEVEVFSMGGEIRSAHFKSYGVQELFEVEMANGEVIRATAGHEWFYNDPKGGLRKTNTLNLAGKRIPIVKTTKQFAEDDLLEGIVHGIVYGDGTVQHGEANVKLFGNKIELVRYFSGYRIRPHYNGDYVGVYGIEQELKHLPDEDVSDSYWHGFIQGLIATDGYVDSRGSIGFHSSNKEELEIIVKNLYKTNFAYSSLRMTREINPFNGKRSPNYKVQLIKNSVDESDLIRTSHKENYSPSSKGASIKVVDVRPTGEFEEVFCCEEPETNSFVIGTGYLTGNCFVMPYPKDSRSGIGEHRNEVMEIMSRGGGVGTNGSTLRPRNALARGVNGKSSGAVSWLNDIASLTHLVEQGGSRRGAQMIMLADWHPDIIEFIISKMQNPNILRHIINTTKDDQIKRLAQEKLSFEPLTLAETLQLEGFIDYIGRLDRTFEDISDEQWNALEEAEQLLKDGGRYTVNNPDFLTGANISVAITKEFMEAVENDGDYELRFPDVENYNEEEMERYNNEWHEVGDVREWEKLGFGVKTYRTIKARELWNLINVCATYSAEPGVFFIDTANEMTNAQAYGQKVVATNPLVNVSGRI